MENRDLLHPQAIMLRRRPRVSSHILRLLTGKRAGRPVLPIEFTPAQSRALRGEAR